MKTLKPPTGDTQFTALWWWLPLRLLKRQSTSSQTVLLRTTLTRTIMLHWLVRMKECFCVAKPVLDMSMFVKRICFVHLQPIKYFQMFKYTVQNMLRLVIWKDLFADTNLLSLSVSCEGAVNITLSSATISNQQLAIMVGNYSKDGWLLRFWMWPKDNRHRRMSGYFSWEGQFLQSLTPLSPNINTHVLLIALHIFLIVLVGRIWLNIKTFCLWWSVHLFSWPTRLIK